MQSHGQTNTPDAGLQLAMTSWHASTWQQPPSSKTGERIVVLGQLHCTYVSAEGWVTTRQFNES